MPTPRIPTRHLIFDFDQTLTYADTISALAALSHRPQQHPFSWYTSKYLADLLHLQSHHTSKWQQAASTRSALDEYLEDLRSVETRSLDRLEANRFFCGVARRSIRELGARTRLRPFAKTLIGKVAECGGARVSVVSVNWSKDLIDAAVVENCGYTGADIRSNNLVFSSGDNGGGFATGEFESPRLVAAADKLRAIGEITRGESFAYFGDSVADLPAILDADVGVLVGRDESVMRWIERLGVDTCVVDGRDIGAPDGGWDKSVVYIIEDEEGEENIEF